MENTAKNIILDNAIVYLPDIKKSVFAEGDNLFNSGDNVEGLNEHRNARCEAGCSHHCVAGCGLHWVAGCR
jgi:hypothetical protein